ncbi:MAG: serine/threonine protein kinase [Myxococcales bacterium]|nr:serine/threonine protein kinase [Myxococcales bacterium]
MSPPAAPAALAPGQRFDRYVVVRALSQGAMGAVYEVEHSETRGRAALKVLLPSLVGSEELRARFKREAMIGANIRSEHVVRTFDAGVDPSTQAPCLVMELLEGEDLEQALLARRRFAPSEVVTFLYHAALALDRAHALGVVHRDLKPGNLFLTRGDDGSPRVKVLDFGIAKVVAEEGAALRTTHSVGTPLYMSPEQILGEGTLGPAADRYALAQVAFALLAGRPYWAPESSRTTSLLPLLGTMAQGPREAATERARAAGVELPAPLDPWFARACAVDPGARFGSALELVLDLARALGVSPPQAVPVVAAASGGGRVRIGWWLAASALVLGAAAVAIALVVSGGTREESPTAASAEPAPLAAAPTSPPPVAPRPTESAAPPSGASASTSSGAGPSATASVGPPRPLGKPTGPRPGYDPTKIR